MKLIIAGSRSFNNYTFLEEKVDLLLWGKYDIEIVSGGAAGADKLGERYAAERKYPVKLFPADWKKHGRSAGFIRNKQMAEYATHCIVFWDGVSPGSSSMINLAAQHKIPCEVVLFQVDIFQKALKDAVRYF